MKPDLSRKIEEVYGGFTLRIAPYKDGSGANGIAFNKNKTRFTETGKSINDVKDKLEEQIRSLSSPKNIADTYKSVTVDFNIEFTNDILLYGPTRVRFFQENDKAMVEVSDDENESGFTKLCNRKDYANNVKDDTPLYQTSFSLTKISDLYLEPHGRYFLEDETVTPKGRKFTLVYDSTTCGPNDSKRLYKPGLTIACW